MSYEKFPDNVLGLYVLLWIIYVLSAVLTSLLYIHMSRKNSLGIKYLFYSYLLYSLSVLVLIAGYTEGIKTGYKKEIYRASLGLSIFVMLSANAMYVLFAKEIFQIQRKIYLKYFYAFVISAIINLLPNNYYGVPYEDPQIWGPNIRIYSSVMLTMVVIIFSTIISKKAFQVSKTSEELYKKKRFRSIGISQVFYLLGFFFNIVHGIKFAFSEEGIWSSQYFVLTWVCIGLFTIFSYFGHILPNIVEERVELEKDKKNLEFKVEKSKQQLLETIKKQGKLLDELNNAIIYKDKFLSEISHELRTPLNGIIGFSEIMIDETFGNLNDHQKDIISNINQSSNDLLNLVNKLLDISKFENNLVKLHKETYLIKDIISPIVEEFSVLASKKEIKLNIIWKAKNDYIDIDILRFKQILRNLLDNALKYTEKGNITLILSKDNKFWKFQIKDTGIGIPQSEYETIFKEFERGQSQIVNTTPGSGLGLSLTKRLINLHGGKIWFKSSLSKGTSFFFKIPIKSTLNSNTI